jgi:pyroglutamyl-peptidase
MRKLLITGFGPFPRVPRNPSETLARAVSEHPRWRRLGISVEGLVLETRYGAISEQLLPKLEAFEPDVVLMLGVAGRRKHVSIETRAVNRVSRLMPDASGRVLGSLAFRPGAPMALYSRAPDTRMLRAMRERGIDARLSRDAGRYLCNASFYAVLERRSAGQAAQIIFIHIPLPRGNYPLCKEKRRNAAIRSHTTNSVRLRDAVIAAGATMFSRTSRMATKW